MKIAMIILSILCTGTLSRGIEVLSSSLINEFGNSNFFDQDDLEVINSSLDNSSAYQVITERKIAELRPDDKDSSESMIEPTSERLEKNSFFFRLAGIIVLALFFVIVLYKLIDIKTQTDLRKKEVNDYAAKLDQLEDGQILKKVVSMNDIRDGIVFFDNQAKFRPTNEEGELEKLDRSIDQLKANIARKMQELEQLSMKKEKYSERINELTKELKRIKEQNLTDGNLVDQNLMREYI